MAIRHFFNRNFVLDDGVVASTDGSSVGTNLPALAIDNDKITAWEVTSPVTPNGLKIDLGTAQAIDSVWFYGENVATYRLYYSTDDITYNAAFAAETDEGNSGFNLKAGFTEQTVRYWRLDATETTGGNNTKIFEIALMNLQITYDEGEAISSVNQLITDRGGGSYTLANGEGASYSGMNNDAKERLEMVFSFLTDAERSALFAWWDNATGDARPEVFINPIGDSARAYSAMFENENFEFDYEVDFTGAGWSGSLVFQQK